MGLRAITSQTLSTNRLNIKRLSNPKLGYNVTARVLLIAGGGGGGYTGASDGGGGGGGAGGLLYYGTETPKTVNGSELTLLTGITYTVTVGGGGAGAYGAGTNGSNTAISAPVGTTYTAIGGGRGAGSAPFGPYSCYGGSGGGLYGWCYRF